MSDLQPIQTLYANRLFRSRLEARWAVAFDAMGLRWEYEPEGFEMDGVRYLPDFLIEDVGWVEIKPNTKLTNDELTKMVAFARGLAKARLSAGAEYVSFHVLCGHPRIGEYAVIGMDANGGYDEASWTECPFCHRIDIRRNWVSGPGSAPEFGLHCDYCDCVNRDWPTVPGVHFHKGDIFADRDVCVATPRLLNAFATASTARFEHGQSGAR